MIGEIIAKDIINGTLYSYRVSEVVVESKKRFEIQISFRGGNWESAFMGRYDSYPLALGGFITRYRGQDIGNLQPFHPVIIKGKEELLNQRIQAQRDRDNAEEKRFKEYQLGLERKAQIEEKFKEAKFKVQTSKCMGAEGNMLPDVKGPSINGLTIHKLGLRSPWQRWGITHQATGFKVGLEYQTQKEAKVCAFRISQYADFTLSPEELADTGIKFSAMLSRMHSNPFADLSDLEPTND